MELGACMLLAAIFVGLTLLPWWLALFLFVAILVAVFGFVHHRKERQRRRIELLERQAEINRAHIKAERIRRDALRPRGGVVR
jgi:membrane protein implicated in regulation of membrane protease activity